MKSKLPNRFRDTSLNVVVCLVAASFCSRAETIYFDNFNDQQNINSGGPYSQTLAGSSPTIRSAVFGGSSSATWGSGAEVNGWGQRDYSDSNVATPTSSNFLPFTPDPAKTYTVEMTVDTTPLNGGGSSSWFTVGFTSSQHNWNGVDAGTIDTGNLVRFNSNKVATISYTVSGATLAAAGVQYVGWVTDLPGGINLNSAGHVRIDNFRLFAHEPNPTITYHGNGSDAGTVPVDPSSPYTNGAAVTVLPSGDLSQTGFRFISWNTLADGSGKTYVAGNQFNILDHTTLYARWQPVQSYVWDGATSSTWNQTDLNWQGVAWSNSLDSQANFASVGGAISLTAISAGTVSVGNTSSNFQSLSFNGGSLAASALTVQGYSSNGGDYAQNPSLTLDSSVTVTGDAAVGRANLVVSNGTFTANRIISAPASADWGRLVVSGGVVTATAGVDGSVHTGATFAVNLNGGELRTPSLRVACREVGIYNDALLTFNGGKLTATTADNADFITTYGGNNALIASGGAVIDTNGFNIGIKTNLLSGGGSGSLVKEGAGSLTLSGANTYTGNTYVSAGTLVLGGGTTSPNLADAAELIIEPGAVVDLNFTGTDTIKQLWIGGSQMAPGVYNATTSPGTITGTGSLTVIGNPVNDYDTWATSFTPNIGAVGADDDADGLNNFQEYAFGLNPQSAASVNPIISSLNRSTGTFTYTRRTGSGRPAFTVEISENLSTWSPATVTESNITPSGNTETVDVTLSPLPTSPKLFVRVKAETNP